MVPRIVIRIARDSSRRPVRRLIIPNIPLVAARYAALMPPDEAHAVKKLVDVELQGLRKRQVTSKKVDVVRKVVQRRSKRVIRIWQALRGKRPNEVIVPKAVSVYGSSSQTIFCGLTA